MSRNISKSITSFFRLFSIMEPDTKNNDSVPTLKEESQSVPEKKRKEYVWTEKRVEAFNKMRKGLAEKTEITKQLKEQKKREEKEAIKQKVKEIMSGKTTNPKKATEVSDSDSEPSSESEVEKKVKKDKKKTVKKAKKRKPVSSSESESEQSESSSSEEEVVEREVLSAKQQKQYRNDKVAYGKAIKRSPYVNPMDRFILL